MYTPKQPCIGTWFTRLLWRSPTVMFLKTHQASPADVHPPSWCVSVLSKSDTELNVKWIWPHGMEHWQKNFTTGNDLQMPGLPDSFWECLCCVFLRGITLCMFLFLLFFFCFFFLFLYIMTYDTTWSFGQGFPNSIPIAQGSEMIRHGWWLFFMENPAKNMDDDLGMTGKTPRWRAGNLRKKDLLE